MNEFKKAVNANVYNLAGWKLQTARYANTDCSTPKSLSWFKERFGVQFCVFEKLADKGRQRACVLCNDCVLRLRHKSGEWVYDDEVDDVDLDFGTIFPVW